MGLEKRVVFRVDAEVWRSFVALATREERTASAVLRRIIKERVEHANGEQSQS